MFRKLTKKQMEDCINTRANVMLKRLVLMMPKKDVIEKYEDIISWKQCMECQQTECPYYRK
jgi:hypothetical protein